MKERIFIKIRTDMYNGTKFKIINRNPRRDLIHYIWSRLLVLAGSVNKEGELFMSRTIPYTIETLAVEFDREPEEIKLAMDLLIQLEMMEFTKEGVYIVKNFAKHQNIKIKEKDKEVAEKVLEKLEVNKEKDIIAESKQKEIKDQSKEKEEMIESKALDKEQHIIKSENYANEKIKENSFNKQEINIAESEGNDSLQQVSAKTLSMRKHIDKKSKSKKKMKSSFISCEEDDEEEPICTMTDGDYVLGEGETIIRSFSFCDDKIIEETHTTT